MELDTEPPVVVLSGGDNPNNGTEDVAPEVEPLLIPAEAKKHKFSFNKQDSSFVPKEQLPLLDQLQSILEKELFYWDDFPINLPPSNFINNNQHQNLFTYYQQDQFDEVASIARDAQGNLKKLTRDQLQQVWRTGKFAVPSEAFPGQNHVWQISGLISRGVDNIVNTWRDNLAMALRQIRVEIPSRFWRGNLWSVKAGLFGMFRGATSLVTHLVGYRKMKPAFSEYTIAEMVEKMNQRFLYADVMPETAQLTASEKSKLIPKDTSEKALPKGFQVLYAGQTWILHVHEHIRQLYYNRDSKWQADKFPYMKKVTADLEEIASKGTDPNITKETIPQIVLNKATEEKIRLFLQDIKESKKLDSYHPGLGTYIINYFLALKIIRGVHMEYESMKEKKREVIVAKLKKDHPVSSRLPEWLESHTTKEMNKYLKETSKYVSEKITKLLKEEPNLLQELYFFERDLDFKTNQKDDLVKKMQKVIDPDDTFTWRRRIYRPENWIITKHTDTTGYVYYTHDKYRTYTCNTAPYIGWRFWDMYHAAVAYWKNGVGVLLWSAFSAGLSLKSLFGREKYCSLKTVSSTTGQIVDDQSSETLPLGYRVGALWRHIRQSRANFEAEPDTGFIGKTVSRVINQVWNYAFKGFVGTTCLVAGMPILIIINVLLSVALIVLSPVWAPVIALLRWFFQLIIYDSRYTRQVLPLFNDLLWMFSIRGVLNIATSLVAGLAVHPVVSLLITLLGSLRAGSRWLYDFLFFNLIIRWKARVPAHQGFLAKRIEGPGLASTIYVQISVKDALVAVLASLERDEISLFQQVTNNSIYEPVHILQRNSLFTLLTPCGATVDTNSHKFDIIRRSCDRESKKLQKLIEARQKLIPYVSGNQYNIRQSKDDLKETLKHAELLVKKFVTERILRMKASRKLYFTERGLGVDDWAGLAKRYLSQTFSDYFLVPLEENDKSVRLKVKHFDMSSFGDMLSGAPSDPLEITTTHQDSLPPPLTPTVPDISAADLEYSEANSLKPIISRTEWIRWNTKTVDEKKFEKAEEKKKK